jgi:hypothetical protein
MMAQHGGHVYQPAHAGGPILPPQQQMPPGAQPAGPGVVPPQPPPPQQIPTAQQQQHLQQMQANELEKNIIESINLITNIREDINIILDNVGKANSANNYNSLLSAKLRANSMDSFAEKNKQQSSLGAGQQQQQQQHHHQVATPSSVSNLYSQNQQQTALGGGSNQADQDQAGSSAEANENFYNLDLKEQEFFEKTDNKYLVDKVIDINKCIR